MSRARTHYDVLGMPRDATTDQLRRAHRDLAVRFHPDHLDAASPDPKARAEADRKIREINEAWRVLGDSHRRAQYDLSLPQPATAAGSDASWSPFPPGAEAEPPGGFAEWHADAERRRREARVVARNREPVRPFRLRLLIGFGVLVLGGILLIVLITGKGDAPNGPPVGAHSCVRVEQGPQAIAVPCSGPNDGKVVGQVEQAGQCPMGSRAARLAAGQTTWTCLATP